MFTKFKMASLMAFLGLIGCATAQTFYEQYKAGVPLKNYPYKAGASSSVMINEATDCQIEAAQRVPQNIVVSTTPSYSTPVQTTCNQIGTQTFCNQTGGQTYGGQTSSYDTNAGLRVRAFEQCMVKKNYLFVDIPACAPGVDLSSQNEELVLRPLSRTTCYQVFPSGASAIGDSDA